MEPEKKSNGAFIGLVIIIIILIAGGIYIWQENKKMKAAQVQGEATLNQDSAALDGLDQELQTTDTNVGVDPNGIN